MKTKIRIFTYNLFRFLPIALVCLSLVLGCIVAPVIARAEESSSADDYVLLPAGTTYMARRLQASPDNPFASSHFSNYYFYFLPSSPLPSSVRPVGCFYYDPVSGGRFFGYQQACYGVYMVWNNSSVSPSLGTAYVQVSELANPPSAASDIPSELPDTGIAGQNDIWYFVCMFDCRVLSSDYSLLQSFGTFGSSSDAGDGYQDGYNVGYSEGYNKGQTEQLNNPASFLLSPAQAFMQIDLFGGFSLGDAFSVVMFVLIATIFIKMFAGG